MTGQVSSPSVRTGGTETVQKLDLTAIRSRIAETPPKLTTIREMTPAEIVQALIDRVALVAENERLRAVAEAARTVFRENELDPYGSNPERYYAAIRALQDHVGALDVGGE